jgi:RNA polymerase sigma-70 factor, ECF subfamily
MELVMEDKFSDADAQAIRAQWFRYLDTVEAFRASLHAYCLKLTGNIWDAEDLLQETLLRGFAMTARGDLHGETSPVANARAYLFRVATNTWIDIQRKTRREVQAERAESAAQDLDRVEVTEAVEKAAGLTSPQEFAALILKEGFDFTLEEIADFVGTTAGTIKSALSRARRKMREPGGERVIDPANQQLATAMVEAINSGNLSRVKALMSQSLTIIVCNVGGGRGRDGVWAEKSLQRTSASYAEYDGEPVILLREQGSAAISDIVRIESADRVAVRLIDYCYAPETLAHVTAKLGLEVSTIGYHQPPKTIRQMIETTRLPWRSG